MIVDINGLSERLLIYETDLKSGKDSLLAGGWMSYAGRDRSSSRRSIRVTSTEGEKLHTQTSGQSFSTQVLTSC